MTIRRGCLGRELSWVLAGQVGALAMGLAGVKIFSTFLGPAEYGRLALAGTIILLITTNFFGALGQGLTRFWSVFRARPALRRFYRTADGYGLYSTLASIALTALIAVPVMMRDGSRWWWLVLASLAGGIASGWLSLRNAVFCAARMRRTSAVAQAGEAAARLAVGVLFLALFGRTAWAVTAAYAVGSLAVLLLVDALSYRSMVSGAEGEPAEDGRALRGQDARDMLNFSLPFVAWGIFNWMHLSCDRWSLQAYLGPQTVGEFAVVSQLAVFPLAFGSGILANLVTPVAFSRAGDLADVRGIRGAFRALHAMTCAYLAGAALMVVLYALAGDRLILAVSSRRFLRFAPLLPWLTGGWALFYLGQVLTSYGMIRQASHRYIMPKVISALAAVGGTFLLVPRMGATGVVAGIGAAGAMYAAWCAIIGRGETMREAREDRQPALPAKGTAF